MTTPGPWATRTLRDADPATLPTYGSPEWEALADDDPAKLAATVRAAEAWRTQLDPTRIAEALWAELEELHALRAEVRAEVEDEVWETYRGAVARPRPSALQLARRRGDTAAVLRLEAQEARLAAHQLDVPDAYPTTRGELQPPNEHEPEPGALPDITTMIRNLGGIAGPVTPEVEARILAAWD